MKHAIGVIGANYGDEGKGLFTSYFVSKQCKGDVIVVRHHGGAQAGHTVRVGNKTHVFSHIGSGALLGAPTYLSQYFVCHPMMFYKEMVELFNIGIKPTVYLHPNCIVTTPYDMILNQNLERNRGENRHGSVGVGFGDTIQRNRFIPLTMLDLIDLTKTRKIVNKIRYDYVAALLQYPTHEELDLINSKHLFDDFISSVEFMMRYTKFRSEKILNHYGTAVFEGSQGLLLDQNHPNFPHVTRSNTGCRNIIEILNRSTDTVELDLYYITRFYVTRHGAGPLPNETDWPDGLKQHDKTNQPHEFQGDLRYAPLDVTSLQTQIDQDVFKHDISQLGKQHIAVTWMDKIKDDSEYYINGVRYTKELIDVLSDIALFFSYGQTSDQCVKLP